MKNVKKSLPFAMNISVGYVKFFKSAIIPQLEWVVLFLSFQAISDYWDL